MVVVLERVPPVGLVDVIVVEGQTQPVVVVLVVVVVVVVVVIVVSWG